MSTYKIKGKRFLRKYTEPELSPVYAASAQAQAIVRDMCTVPWEVSPEANARMTYHTEENFGTEENPITGLDMAVKIRESFDAALFCAEHKAGQHRAYANAAVYRYAIPAAAVGTVLTSLKVNVTSDPYNSVGVRLHVWTGSTGTIPTDCNTVRGNDQTGTALTDGTTAAEVVKRTEQTIDGKAYWFPTSSTVNLAPVGGLTLQAYLFLSVSLENYSTVRGNWLEGSAFIENLVTIETSGSVSGWTDGDKVDLVGSGGSSLAVVSNSGNAIVPTIEINGFIGNREFTGTCSGYGGLNEVYAQFALKREDPAKNTGSAAFAQNGVSFRVQNNGTKILSTLMMARFMPPHAFKPRKMRFSIPNPSGQGCYFTNGAYISAYVASGLVELTKEIITDQGLYSGDGSGPFKLVGRMTAPGDWTFDISSIVADFVCGTIILSAYMPIESFTFTTPNTAANQGVSQLFPLIYIED